MKNLIVVVFIVTIAGVNSASIDIPDAFKQKALQLVSECRTQITITDEELNKMKDGENFDGNENVKCFTNCFQEKAGILKDGVFQEASVLKNFSATIGEEKAKAIVAACRGESGSGKCETAYKLHQCFHKNGAY